MFTLPSLGLNTLKLISANKVLVASCFLEKPETVLCRKIPGDKTLRAVCPAPEAAAPVRCGAVRGARGQRGRDWPCPAPGRRREPGEGAAPAEGGPGRAPAPPPIRKWELGGGSRRERGCPGPRAAQGRARWVAERDGARGAHLHPAGGSAQLLRVCLKLRVL